MFLIADLIPHICRTLSHADIAALILVNRKIARRLRKSSRIQRRIVKKIDAVFGVVETLTASVIMRTTISIHMTYSKLRIVHTIQYCGSHIGISERGVNNYIIHTKEDIVQNHITTTKKIVPRHAYADKPLYYMDFIYAIINYIYDDYDLKQKHGINQTWQLYELMREIIEH